MPVATVPTLPSFAELESAAELVHRFVPPTPQYSWPLLNQRAGCEVWMKHENHTPVGAFKVRGGIVYMDWLRRAHPETRGVISATRGNHGQSQAFTARQFGLSAVVVVPFGNSREKNAAMRALGAELVAHEVSVDILRGEIERVVQVTDDEIEEAMRAIFTDTHNVAEGAGAAAVAALLKEREAWSGKRVGVVLSGGNVDREVFARVMANELRSEAKAANLPASERHG